MLFAAAIVTLSCAAVAVALTRAAAADLRADLEARGLAIARGLSARAGEPLSLGDMASLQALLDTMWEEDDVARALLVDARGRRLAARDFGGPAIDDEDATVLYPVTGAPDAEGYRDALGMVRVVLSARGLEARRQRYVDGALRTTAVVASAGVVLAAGIGFALAAPIRRLRAATAVVAEGAYDTAADDIPRGGSREVRELGDTLRTAVRAVAERETELNEVNRQLRETEAARDAMTHMIIHDLKGPIGNVLTVLAVIEGSQEEQEDRELVAEVRTRCRDLLRMIEDQLDLGRLSQGRLELDLERLEVGEVFAGAMATIEHLVRAAGFEVRVELPEEELEFSCDRALTQRVVMNLVVNATRYGASPVTLSAASTPDGVRLEVSDAGPGVPEAMAEAVFEPYRSLPDEEGRRHGGAGLGLAFVRLAVEAHGGRVSVDGARFSLVLPT